MPTETPCRGRAGGRREEEELEGGKASQSPGGALSAVRGDRRQGSETSAVVPL